MNGVINFLKPPGMSSNGAVVFIRGLLGGVRTGHAGTLDPGACGVLPICVGRATKISSYLMNSAKEYLAEITFGLSTDTGDSYGRITKRNDSPLPVTEEVESVLNSFKGIYSQQTPAYSAVHHNGKRLYKLAQESKEIPQMFRDVHIYETEYVKRIRRDSHIIRVVCGKGTYIRVLCEDIGRRLGLPAYMSFLARTKCAGLDINESYTADELEKAGSAAVQPADNFLAGMPKIFADASARKPLVNGAGVRHEAEDIPEARVYSGGGFIGIGCVKNGRMKITTLLTDG